jgi:hypothetical protein
LIEANFLITIIKQTKSWEIAISRLSRRRIAFSVSIL